MPITPFHFGPGAALHAGAPRHVSFLAFFSANVLIDLESFINFTYGFEPVHAFFHTYVGASIVVAFIAAVFAGLRWSVDASAYLTCSTGKACRCGKC